MSGPLFFALNKMTPTLEQFKKYASESNVIPVYSELLADLETPVSVFTKLDGLENCFLFESAENVDNWGRYSFIGFSPRATFSLVGKKSKLVFADGKTVQSTSEKGLDPLAPLRDYLASRKPAKLATLPRFFGGAVGYFGRHYCLGYFIGCRRGGYCGGSHHDHHGYCRVDPRCC